MARGGRRTGRAGPERRCIVGRTSGPAAGLVRFVAGPDGRIVPDVAGRLPGRGMWVAADRASLERAAEGKPFAKAAGRSVTVPDGLVEEVERQLARRVADTIALARKAGQAVAGRERAKAWLERGTAAVLVQARDGSERERARLAPPPGGTRVACLTASELGAAFGRERAVHCALASGELGKRVVEDAARLEGVRAGTGGETRPAAGRDDGTE